MAIKPIEKWQSDQPSKASRLKEMQSLGLPVPVSYVWTNHDGDSKLDMEKRYAVRSSRTAEDGNDRSFAGMFDTILNVPAEQVKDKAKQVLEGYGLQGEPVNLNSEIVLIQEMVEPVYAGVIFTRNPVNGYREMVIELVEGLGSYLVQEGKEPSRIKVKWGRFLREDVPVDASADKWLKVLCRYASKAEKHYGYPVDLEWAYDGSKVWVLQVRPITTTAEIDVYDNTIAKNYLPGMIPPLVYDVNVPLVNGAWVEILEEILGPLEIEPSSLAKSFYYRTYFNMGTMGQIFRMIGFREDFLEKLQGIHDERIDAPFRPTWKLLRNGFRAMAFVRSSRKKVKQLSAFLESYHQRSLELEEAIEGTENPQILWHLFSDLQQHNAKGAHYKILIPLLNIASQRKFDKAVRDKELMLGPSEYLAENSDYDPSAWLKTTQEKKSETFLKRFGHFSENNNDFSVTTWSEDPSFVETLLSAETKEPANVPTLDAKTLKMKKKVDYGNLQVNKLTYYYNYSYHLFRKVFIKLARLLVEDGTLEHEEDIFYLTLVDLKIKDAHTFRAYVRRVKAEFEQYADVVLPAKIYGQEKPLLLGQMDEKSIFKGVPMAPGRVEGNARVVTSIRDIGEVCEGEILILPHSDMSFEPLLGKASAVLIEAGGVLSHIGILARERGIPAITSLKDISRLKSGMKLAVDSHVGDVYVLDEHKEYPLGTGPNGYSLC